MFQHQSFIFYLIYLIVLVIFSIKAYRYFDKKYHVDITSKNTIIVSEKRIIKTTKQSKNIEKLTGFPFNLDMYIREPSSDIISTMLIETLSVEKTNDIYDIYRCITISSVLFNTHIPLHLICIDTRTKELYNYLKTELDLKYVVVMDRHKEKIKEAVINDFINTEALNNKYHYRVSKVGQIILDYSDKGSFPGINELTRKVNLLLSDDEQLTVIETKSLATAFSAITMIKIPHVYINCDMLAMVLMHFIFDKSKYKIN